MNRTKVLIIEDELPSARLLCNRIGLIRPNWEITLLHGSVVESIKWFTENPHPDLIFLDIQLADGNSFEFLSKIRPQSLIIFTTAYDEYAIRAFTVNSIDYLLKPIDDERLLQAIQKYESIKLYDFHDFDNYLETVLESLQQKDKRFRTRFLISYGNKFQTLPVNEIAYFYSENKITYAVTGAGEEYAIDFSLNKLQEQLDPERFYRANRSIFLCVDAIKQIRNDYDGKLTVLLKPSFKEIVSISREKAMAFKMWLDY